MSNVLLRNAHVIDPNSPLNGKHVDLLIEDGIITKTGSNLNSSSAREITSNDLHVAPGFMDLHAHICDPGFEYKETLESAAAAAAKGGFTALLAMPDTNPVIDTKTQVEYVRKRSLGLPVEIIPAGALSVHLEGKDMAELFDMYSAGARVFCDAEKPITNAGLLVRALMYAHQFGGKIFTRCDDKTVSHGGQMNEGPMSTMLGLKGIPGLAEELMVARNIYLAEYAGTPIHFMAISTARSVELIRKAKQDGLPVTAAVHAYNLYWNDSVLSEFDTNFKVNPPLREEKDRLALIEGVKDGTIDCISSGHTPEDVENKVVEFDLAAFGMTALETAFSLALNCGIPIETLVKAFSIHPRRITGTIIPTIKEGAAANLTAFDPKAPWTYSHTKSLSKNSPLLGQEMKGGVLGIVVTK